MPLEAILDTLAGFAAQPALRLEEGVRPPPSARTPMHLSLTRGMGRYERHEGEAGKGR